MNQNTKYWPLSSVAVIRLLTRAFTSVWEHNRTKLYGFNNIVSRYWLYVNIHNSTFYEHLSVFSMVHTYGYSKPIVFEVIRFYVSLLRMRRSASCIVRAVRTTNWKQANPLFRSTHYVDLCIELFSKMNFMRISQILTKMFHQSFCCFQSLIDAISNKRPN